jgi:hypothetical protein
MVNLREHEWCWRSQHGEDGVIEKIFETIPPKYKTFIEIGAHFHEANALKLSQHMQWKGMFFDDFHHFPPLGFYKAWITVDNINQILRDSNIPLDFDLFSLDIDGNDFYVMSAIEPQWRPRVIIVESNLCFGIDFDAVIEYDAQFRWDGTIYQGATPLAWFNLLRSRNYSLVYVEKSGVNMFFMDDQLCPEQHFINVNDMTALYESVMDTYEPHAPDPLERPWYSSEQATIILKQYFTTNK